MSDSIDLAALRASASDPDFSPTSGIVVRAATVLALLDRLAAANDYRIQRARAEAAEAKLDDANGHAEDWRRRFNRVVGERDKARDLASRCNDVASNATKAAIEANCAAAAAEGRLEALSDALAKLVASCTSRLGPPPDSVRMPDGVVVEQARAALAGNGNGTGERT